ncbi:MAG: cyclic peptide export ABC transporter [Cyclobacteriaceae bacterium]
MKLILNLIKKNLWQYVIGTMFSMGAGTCGALVIKQIHGALKGGLDSQQFIMEFGLYLAGSVILGLIGSQILTKISARNLKELTVSLSKKILRAPYRNIEIEQDKIIPILTTDLARIGSTAAQMPDIITSVFILLGCFIYMLTISLPMTLIGIGIFVVNMLMITFLLPLLRSHEDDAKDLRYKLFKQLKAMVSGLKELSFKKKLRQSYVNQLIAKTIDQRSALQVKNTLLINSFGKLENLMVMIALGVAVAYAQGTELMKSGEFVEFLAIAIFLVTPMRKVNGFLRVIHRTTMAIGQIESLGVQLSGYQPKATKKIPVDGWSSKDPIISFREITHTYESEEEHESFEMGPISFDAYENETVFIIGGNGSGKTTLIKLLTGLYAPQSGSLIYKNHPITEEYLDNYQNTISPLFSDDFVFDILYHIDDDILESQGQEYLDYLELSKKVKIVDQKYTTTNLSFGQKKRLNLITGLLENKDIYVFDEWAANQDPYFKTKFYEEILPKLKQAGKTIFVISHDDSYFFMADRKIKLRDGKKVDVPEAELIG